MDSAYTAGLNGLNWQVQVWPCSLGMVTVPPFLCGPLSDAVEPPEAEPLCCVLEQPATARTAAAAAATSFVPFIALKSLRGTNKTKKCGRHTSAVSRAAASPSARAPISG